VFFPQREFLKKYRNENFLPLEHGFQLSEQTPAMASFGNGQQWRRISSLAGGISE